MSGLECSEVLMSDLDLGDRIDAEYFTHEYLHIEDILSKKSTISLKQLGHLVASAFYPAATQLYDSGEIPFVRCVDSISFPAITHLQENSFERIPESFILENKGINIIKHNDIVITKVGTPCFSSIVKDYKKVALSRTVLGLTDIQMVMPEYLLVFLRSRYGFLQLYRVRELTIQYQLTLERVGKVNVLIASSKFQTLIKEAFEQYLFLTRNAATEYEQAEKLLLSALALDTFAPSQENTSVKNFSEISSSGRLDAEYYQKKYDEIESKVKSCPHGYVFVIDFFNLVKDGFDKQKDCYPYIEIGDINISEATAVYNVIPTEELPANAKIKVQTGDILVSKVRPNRGAVAIVPAIPDLIVSGAFCVLRSTGRYSSEVLLVLLKSRIYREWLLKWNVGTSYPVIKDDNVCNLPLPLLPNDTQKAIAEKIRHSFALREESKALLKAATRAVEIAIEQDEAAGMEFLHQFSS